MVIAVAERDFDGVGEEGEERECAGEEEKEIHGEGCGLVVASKDCRCPSRRPLLEMRAVAGFSRGLALFSAPVCASWPCSRIGNLMNRSRIALGGVMSMRSSLPHKRAVQELSESTRSGRLYPHKLVDWGFFRAICALGCAALNSDAICADDGTDQ